MRLTNTRSTYGAVHIALHWLTAIATIGLFVSGLWMVDLGYYDPWYHRAPELHKAVGVLLLVVIGLRLVWRWTNGVPAAEPTVKRWERHVAEMVHALLYVGLLVVIVSGYLIATAKGQAVDVFGLIAVPATLQGSPRQADTAGDVHYWVAIGTIAFAGLHALAALKHHLIDRDATLKRMLGLKRCEPLSQDSRFPKDPMERKAP